MSYDLMSEEAVKNFLHLKDFRNITKQDIILLTSNLHRMPPEIAKKCIEQFPDFANAATIMVNELSSFCAKAVDAGEAESLAIIDTYKTALEQLETILQDPDVSESERTILINAITQIGQYLLDVKRLGVQEREHHVNVLARAVALGTSILGIAIGAGLAVKNGEFPKIPEIIQNRLLPKKEE